MESNYLSPIYIYHLPWSIIYHISMSQMSIICISEFLKTLLKVKFISPILKIKTVQHRNEFA